MGEEHATSEAFARPDMAEGSLWIETPQTAAATEALFRVLDLTRLDDKGWEPFWVLSGEPGVGKSALAKRFAAQAQRSAACDAVRVAEEALARAMRKPRKIPSPEQFKLRDNAWERYRTFAAMSPEERVRRFGSCPHVCKPVEWLPEESFRAAVRMAEGARPVEVRALERRDTTAHQLLSGAVLDAYGGDAASHAIRRTSLILVDDAEHLVRLNATKRAEALDELLRLPSYVRNRHNVSFMLVGSPALAAAVAACGPVRRITLEPMRDDGPDGTFALVCRRVFGPVDQREVERLHRASNGAMGPLLNVARLQGLKPPFAVPEKDILRLPAPDRN